MSKKNKDFLLRTFGTDNVEAIVAKKSSEKQDRFVVSEKSARVKMSADECKKLCKKAGIKYLDGYEERVIPYRFTDETVDRYGDIVEAKGGDLKNYKLNPVILAFHDYSTLPVGAGLNVSYDKATNSINGNVLFYDDRVDRTGFADTAFRFADAGAMRAGSIGFLPFADGVYRPTDEERAALGMGKWGLIYKKWELLEFTICPVPANPSALQNHAKSIQRGFFTRENIEAARAEDVIDESAYKTLLSAIERVANEETGKGINIPQDTATDEGEPAIPQVEDELTEEDVEALDSDVEAEIESEELDASADNEEELDDGEEELGEDENPDAPASNTDELPESTSGSEVPASDAVGEELKELRDLLVNTTNQLTFVNTKLDALTATLATMKSQFIKSTSNPAASGDKDVDEIDSDDLYAAVLDESADALSTFNNL